MAKPSNEELTSVLTEFHQRNQGLIKPVGPPPPFEITSVVVQQPPTKFKDDRRDSPPLIEQPRALVAVERNFDWELTSISGEQSGFPFWLQWYWRCHDQYAIANESYIRVYPGGYWISVNPPGYGGGIIYGFNGSTWTPPAYDQQGISITLSWIALNFPIGTPGHPINIYQARAYMAFYIQDVDSPYTISDHIYAIGNPNSNAIEPYQAANGLGFIWTFHGTIY